MKLVLFMIVAFNLLHRLESLSCVKQLSTCSCETNFGAIVLDFSDLDAGGRARIAFTALDTSTGVSRTIEYNPCTAFISNYGSSAAA